MFYSQDLAITLLELGRDEEFLRMFYTILAANISPDTLTTFEWWNNTQPHLHSISSMIRMARTRLIQERDGALWVATGFANLGGAARLADGAWTRLTRADGLAGEKVRSVYADRAGSSNPAGAGDLTPGSRARGAAS